jgi:ribosomal protein S27AE
MSEKIYCGKCNMLLYFGEEIKRRLYMRAIPSEETVLGFYNNVCPRCGNKLSLQTVNIKIEGRKKWHTTKS